MSLLQDACLGTGEHFGWHECLVLVSDLGQLHQLLAFQLQQAHAHVRHLTVLNRETLLSTLFHLSQLGKFSEVVRKLQVNFILHERLQFLHAGQRVLSQLSMPLLVDLQRIVRLLYAQFFLKSFHICLKLVHTVINLCLELTHISFHSVYGIINLVFDAYNLA